MTDGELLRCYVRDHSEKCFEELVRRHIDLIYSAALRQTNHDPHHAEDIVQSVFTDLARKARQLCQHPSLAGWLYTSTRFVAANLRRTELRRLRRESAALTMNELLSATGPEPDWARLRPLLDEAMHQLEEPEREAVLLRHFQNQSYAEIGSRCGLSENAARMRVQRALEKLQGLLARQGVTSTAAALAALLAAQAVSAAPAHLAAKVAATAFAGAATAGGVGTVVAHILSLSKARLAAGALSAVLATALIVTLVSKPARPGISTVMAVTSPPTNSSSGLVTGTTNQAVSSLPVPVPMPVKAAVTQPKGLVLHLQIITADTGQPIPLVPLDYAARVGNKYQGKKLLSDRFGVCNVVYPTNTTELELTTRKDDFADTKLLWRPVHGEVIPTNYVLRLDRPVAIGGLVVDPDGHPVAGATVGWNHRDDPAAMTLPQNHEFGWVETTTDADGRWRINRVGADMIPRLYGSASASNYVVSGLAFVSQDKSLEQQLRAGTLVFKLGRAVTVKGLVTDAAGVPVPRAKILVGPLDMDGSRQGRALDNGTFSIPGCQPGRQLVTAEAPGLAATTREFDLDDPSSPVQLILQPGQTLRLKVVDQYGTPIPRAYVWYDQMGRGGPDDPKPVQVSFEPRTDRAGRVTWTNAPVGELKFAIQAPGFLRKDDVTVPQDGEEHVITLSQSVVIHGAVWDQATGNRIPKFRIVQGWPEVDPVTGTTNAIWSTLSRFWLDFTGGSYRQSLEEAVMGGARNHGYILKFIADGYAPFISRVIGPDEGDVEMNVTLQRAEAVMVTVNTPDGRPAASADIGLVFPGARLELIPGGFSRQNVQSGGSLLRTDAQGTFALSPDDSVTRVIAATRAGYAEATPAELRANPVLQLQPWGRLEVRWGSPGRPAASRSYAVDFDGGSQMSVSFDPRMARVATDAPDHFTATMLPPGQLALSRIYTFKIAGGEGWMNGDRTPLEIRPGETTTLDLDASSYTVTARLQWPVGMARQAAWQIAASLHTVRQPLPPDVATNPAARRAYMRSDEYRAAHRDDRAYQATVNPDDTLVLDGVKPGDYDLSVFVNPAGTNDPAAPYRPNAGPKTIAQGRLQVTVPGDPPAGNFDAGPIQLTTP